MTPPPPLLLLLLRRFPLLLLLLLLHPIASATCPSTCATLPISYPFGAAPSCGAPGFLLRCDSGPLPLWPLPLHPLSNYTVLDIANYDHASGFITLLPPPTTSQSDSQSLCSLIDKDQLDDTTPSSYPFAASNLSDFSQFADLVFSSQDVYLLFGCDITAATSLQYPGVVVDSFCPSYLSKCPLNITGSCARFLPTHDLNLAHLLGDLNCAGYKSFIATPNINSDQWNDSTIQLHWSNVPDNDKCIACENSGGNCGYDMSNHNSFRCFCSGNRSSGTDCTKECIGYLCTVGAKVAAFGVPSALMVIASLTIFVVCMASRKREQRQLKIVSGPDASHLKDGSQQILGSVSAKTFSLEELLHATDFFSDDRIIGQGGFGIVYEGRLEDGRKVAIKRLDPDRFTRMGTFFNETRILSSLHHKNLVTMYGFCCEAPLLVFEYVSNGTLAEHLHKNRGEGLPWKARLDIACETAEALSYLHNSVTPPIFHRDVKSSNILLDDNYHAKLSDFGISRIGPLQASHISTAPQGTPGYLDPEYFTCYQFTDKSDVYSFGIVLLELVSGKLPVDMSRDSDEVNLARFARARIACGTWCETVVDPRLGIDVDPEVQNMVGRVLKLACQCLAKRKDNRPKMKDVAEALGEIRKCGYGGYRTDETKVEIFYGKREADGTIQILHSTPDTVESLWPSCNTSPDLSMSLRWEAHSSQIVI